MEYKACEDNHCMEESLEHKKILEMTFSSLEEAQEFYYDYAKKKGFGVRKQKLRKRGTERVECFRRFLCCRAGFREAKYFNGEKKQRKRPLTRCDCPAKFSVGLDKRTGNWHVKEFIDNHNHEFAYGNEVLFLRSHRKIDSSKENDIISLKLAGLRQSQIMDVLEQKAGGLKELGFVKKDLYNFSSKRKQSIILHGDAEIVLKCMKERNESDVEFFFDYKTDDDGCLTALFWSDSQSRIDYQCFGDVMAFDSTYRVNRYNMPFIPFVGVNHHRSTTIFGCGIVANETAESYEWLLLTLLTAMYQAHPKSVITDGCPSMAKAIRNVLPRTDHRLCSWHIEQNMMRHLHHSDFGGFKSLLYDNSSDPKKFESRWNDYIGTSKSLKDNDWLKLMYKSKERWAPAFLRNKLFLGLNSTQRNEGLNARLHMYLDGGMYLIDLVAHYEHCLSHIRQNELSLESKASSSIPNAETEFVGLENNIARIYTEAIFSFIQPEIALSKNYEVVEIDECDDKIWYVLKPRDNVGKRVIVECVGGGMVESMKCTCMKLDCDKIPCRHIFKVLIERDINVIPECCVWKRWTKGPKTCLPAQGPSLVQWFELTQDETNQPLFGVSDPKVMVGRGAPRKRIKSFLEVGKTGKTRCGHCRELGHNIQTCSKIRKGA